MEEEIICLFKVCKCKQIVLCKIDNNIKNGDLIEHDDCPLKEQRGAVKG